VLGALSQKRHLQPFEHSKHLSVLPKQHKEFTVGGYSAQGFLPAVCLLDASALLGCFSAKGLLALSSQRYVAPQAFSAAG
jgi:hypothetical protein